MRFLIALALLSLAACRDDRPEAPTSAENAQLDEAGNMLDALANEDGNAS